MEVKLILQAGRVTHPDAPQQKVSGVVSPITTRYSLINQELHPSLFMGLQLSQQEVVNSDSFRALRDT